MHAAGMILSPPPHPDPHWAWFFDIDGTLIELASEPSSLQRPHHLAELLAAVRQRVGGAMALVSGRSVANILALIAPLEVPLSGCHGLERYLADGRLLRPPPSPRIDRARGMMKAFAEKHPGIVLEDKGLTLALHYRHVPHLEIECAAVVAQAASGDLEVLAGKMVFEVKPRGVSKGTALRAFMETDPFRGRLPIFLGDDLTDEDGFEAVAALGGKGVLVGPPRPTKATFRLQSVPALHDWLAGLSA